MDPNRVPVFDGDTAVGWNVRDGNRRHGVERDGCCLVSRVYVSAAEATLLFDDFSYDSVREDFEANWSVAETGDEQMAWLVSQDVIVVGNSESAGGNDQTVILGRQVDTAGYNNIHVSLGYSANDEDDFEKTDFIRIQGYESGFLSSPLHVEATTEGVWVPGVNPPTTLTFLEADFGTYSWDNSNFWVAIEVNTSLDREHLYIDSITVTGIPEPAALTLLALGGLAMLRRRRRGSR